MARRRDHVRSVRRRIAYGTGPDHELLSWPFWAEHKLYYGHHRSALLIVLQSPGTSQIITAHAARGFAFFVWGPDLERHWPGICPELAPKAKQDDDGPQVTFAKELLQEKFPGGEWRTMRPTAAYHAVEELAENHGRPMPGVDSFSRALGRRKKPI